MQNRANYKTALVVAVLVVTLYLSSRIHYLLFHGIAEIFSIVIACAVFMISWNAREQIENSYLVNLGIAYLFIGIIDFFHMLSYTGMNIFTDYDYYANQLWIGARYLESLTLLAFFYFTGSKKRFSYVSVYVFYTLFTSLLLLSVFYWKVFPICLIEGQGLTPFKKISEYIICTLLILSLVCLQIRQNQFDGYILKLFRWMIILTIFGELAFTFYISNYGLSNLIGHLLKIGSFFLVYKAIIESGLKRPFELLFKELKRSEEDLKTINLNLNSEVTERKRAETQLRAALKEKETLLQGIHHRVKNNMTVISSLLGLQMNNTDNDEIKEALKDSQNRVRTMSQIHETLYRSDNISVIDMQSYLSELGKTILQSYANNGKIVLNFDVENIMIGVKQASPLGLIVNELMTNSIKHGFPDSTEGEIGLQLKLKNENETELTVSDSGIGIPRDLDWKNTDSLGLRLVMMLAENQLHGSIKKENKSGTKFIISFNIEE